MPTTPFSSRAGWSGCTRPTRRRCTSRLVHGCRPPPALPELDRALYEDPTLLRMIGMRRTMFVFSLELAAVVQAACTESIAAAQRRRYAKQIEEGGIAKDGRRWLYRAEAATLKALRVRGEAFATELSSDVPQLRKKVHYGEGKTWAGSTSMTSWVLFMLAAEGRIVRGRPRGDVDEQPVELGAGGVLAEGASRTTRARGGLAQSWPRGG